MAKSTIKKDSGFGVAQLILLISIAILVIFVAWPVLLILFNAFFVEGKFTLRQAVEIDPRAAGIIPSTKGTL